MLIPFTRDRFTWLAYFLLGYYAYLQASLGPLMPYLRDELNLSYTTAGFHFSAFAIGMIVSGLLADQLASMWGRPVVFWGGTISMAFGGLVLVSGNTAYITIAASFIMGSLGSLLLVMIQATLSDRHTVNRAIALTESNLTASIFAAFAPFIIGLSVSFGIGWRGGIYFAVIFAAICFMLTRDTPIPESEEPDEKIAKTHGKLPIEFWMYCVVIFISTAIEWSMIFWGADFLEKLVKLPRENASTTMSIFFGAMIIGRLLASRSTRSIRPRALLFGALVVIAIGFPMLWLGEIAIINITGLFISGLGVANLYPLGLSAAVNVAPKLANKASARISLASGVAIFIMPQLLGTLADDVGIWKAFAVIPILLTIDFVLLGVVIYKSRHGSAS